MASLYRIDGFFRRTSDVAICLGIGLVAMVATGCAYEDRNQSDPLLGGRPATPTGGTTAGVYTPLPGTSTSAGAYPGNQPTTPPGTVPPIYTPASRGGTVMLTNSPPQVRDGSPDLRIPSPPGPGMTTGGGIVVATPSPLGPGSPAPGVNVSGPTPPTPPAAPPTTGGLTVTVPPPASGFDDVWARLQSQGMVDSQFEGSPQTGYSFTGHFIYPQQPDKFKTVVGNGPSVVAAMQAVADQVGR
ncbi:MAG TPA: hypothetical protein VGY66_10780 [Gemmataceae bacterium]|nr:hypothetical protein [Gemmataceae bacterium]